MKVGLGEKQIEFLAKKFMIDKIDVEKMSLDEWNSVREKCFEIETNELLDFEETGGNCDDCKTEDYLMASSIIDLPYKL